MQKRHTDRERYFREQALTSRNHYIPYIKKMVGRLPRKILEVGCGEGGNLLPFAEEGCEVVGVDLSASRIEQARKFFEENRRKGEFIAADIFGLESMERDFPLIILHDVIEHIADKRRFLSSLKDYLSAGGAIFVGFPAWQMPFGGHQQIARSKIISHAPFIHLLPEALYQMLLKRCGEQEDGIKELLEIKRTGCSIEMFKRIVRDAGYRIVHEQLYFINPHYETKFGLSPRKLNKLISRIPYIRNYFSTSCFYILKVK